eukprot:Selendium_serpulae@DN2308_c0_g1_i1.p1
MSRVTPLNLIPFPTINLHPESHARLGSWAAFVAFHCFEHMCHENEPPRHSWPPLSGRVSSASPTAGQPKIRSSTRHGADHKTASPPGGVAVPSHCGAPQICAKSCDAAQRRNASGRAATTVHRVGGQQAVVGRRNKPPPCTLR